MASSDPVWTLRTGSFFLIQSSAEQFFETNFIKFHVQLNDRVGTKARTKFGVVNVSKDELLNGKGDRIQYEIMPEVKKTHGVSKYFMMNLVTGRLASRNEGKKKVSVFGMLFEIVSCFTLNLIS